MIYKVNGNVIPKDTPFEIDGIKFPANWLIHATSEDLERFGIVAEVEPDVVLPETPPAVPEEVTPRQLRLALHEIGLLNQVNSFLAVADEATKIEWEYASVLRRDHQMWIVGAQYLNRTSEDIDNLFILAGTK